MAQNEEGGGAPSTSPRVMGPSSATLQHLFRFRLYFRTPLLLSLLPPDRIRSDRNPIIPRPP